MPATYSVVPTVSTGDWITAGWVNTYIGGNLAANWPGTTTGDMEYYLSAVEKARLAKPSVDSLFAMGTSGVPSWLAKSSVSGLHTKNKVSFNPGGQTFSGTWADITGASMTLVLTTTCTIKVEAVVSGYNGSVGRSFYIRAVVNGVADATPNDFFNGGGTARYEAFPYIYYTTGIPAGSRNVKLQCQADTDPNVVDRGRLMAFAYPE